MQIRCICRREIKKLMSFWFIYIDYFPVFKPIILMCSNFPRFSSVVDTFHRSCFPLDILWLPAISDSYHFHNQPVLPLACMWFNSHIQKIEHIRPVPPVFYSECCGILTSSFYNQSSYTIRSAYKKYQYLPFDSRTDLRAPVPAHSLLADLTSSRVSQD